MDLCGNGGHLRGENSIELAEVCKVARKVERQRIEGVGVFRQEGQRVGVVDLGFIIRDGSPRARHAGNDECAVRGVRRRKSEIKYLGAYRMEVVSFRKTCGKPRYQS
jgi:hypothetical protein